MNFVTEGIYLRCSKFISAKKATLGESEKGGGEAGERWNFVRMTCPYVVTSLLSLAMETDEVFARAYFRLFL